MQNLPSLKYCPSIFHNLFHIKNHATKIMRIKFGCLNFATQLYSFSHLFWLLSCLLLHKNHLTGCYNKTNNYHVSKVSRKIANSIERKNTHQPVYYVKDFSDYLSVTNFWPQLSQDRLYWIDWKNFGAYINRPPFSKQYH